VDLAEDGYLGAIRGCYSHGRGLHFCRRNEFPEDDAVITACDHLVRYLVLVFAAAAHHFFFFFCGLSFFWLGFPPYVLLVCCV